MLQQRKPLVILFGLIFLITLAACGGDTEEFSEEATASPTEEVEPTPEEVAVDEEFVCAWNQAGIIGHWEDDRGNEYQFTASGKYFHIPVNSSIVPPGGTWACAEGPDKAIVLTRSTLPNQTAIPVRHVIVINGSDSLAIENAPILTGVFIDYNRIEE